MKVTGIALINMIKELEVERETATDLFQNTQKCWPDEVEKYPSLAELDNNVIVVEGKISLLQTAQAMYNLANRIEIDGEDVTLEELIKRMGVVRRTAQRWKPLATAGISERNYYRQDTRQENEIARVNRYDVRDSIITYRKAERLKNHIRSQINAANMVQINIDLPGLVEIFENADQD